MIKLNVHEAAAVSIIEQADYYRGKAGPALAARWENAINEAIGLILHSPETGSPCRFRSPFLAGMRWTVVPGFPKHMVFYRYVQTEQTAFVVQVLHGARNIESILGDEEDTN